MLTGTTYDSSDLIIEVRIAKWTRANQIFRFCITFRSNSVQVDALSKWNILLVLLVLK